MRVLVQRVRRAQVTVEDRVTGSIGPGLLLLVGIRGSDTDAELSWMAKKVVALRIFADEAGKMNRSVKDQGGECLVVSQFTLYGDATKGNRPSFIDAGLPAMAKASCERFVQLLQTELGRPVPTGVFGADMQVELQNDGPVTIWLEREAVAKV
ncbi:MAG: D-tyrosyl-tRNA(Tyr) deacylase [Deltaproteobacteria bacterium]|jgi:D-tyrosyl-tRNA(Tyr) deacylase|nr:D-tyrosyl-tRNA(Tyr) deacylase [Deltaproteobacteria bacterium]